jgi:outer membrane protein assembly factor BamA
LISSRFRFLLFFFPVVASLNWFSAWGAVPEGELKIGQIVINRKNIFETGTEWDKKFPYSWANKIHIVTQEYFVRRELLFQSGDPLDMELINESERLLRAHPIFRNVTFTLSEPLNGAVDVTIETEDVWTTTVQLNFGVAGGEQSYQFGILERINAWGALFVKILTV